MYVASCDNCRYVNRDFLRRLPPSNDVGGDEAMKGCEDDMAALAMAMEGAPRDDICEYWFIAKQLLGVG